jgi:hypothetical protein
VYPFIEGDTSFTGMTDEQWKEVGTIFHQIHQVTLPPEGFESLQIEAALLRALSNVDLPFRLSLPIRTQSGDSVAFLEQDSKMLAFATLSPFLPGKRPDRNDPSLASPAGTALAMLDNALATLQEKAVYAGFEPTFSYESLLHGYSPVPDPLTAVERLPILRKVHHTQVTNLY